MLTRKRWNPPTVPQGLDADVQRYLRELNKSVSDYLLSLEAKGSLTIGEAEINANQGIKFPATQVASSDANTLDDYEEGTWTPSVGGNATYTSRSGTYEKIGRAVIARFQITINAIGTGATGAVSGLPFTVGATAMGSVSYWNTAAANFVFVGCYANGGTTDVRLTGATAAAASVNDPAAVLQNGTTVYGSVVYYV